MVLTQEQLKDIITYDKETGEFFWKVFKSGRKMSSPIGACTGAGYLVTTINYKQYSLHRLAFLYVEGSLPKGQVDHIDNNKVNNRWENLRHANCFTNAQNKLLSSSNTSGFKGVCWDTYNSRWKASINYDGKAKHLGMFKDKNDAIAAVKEFREKVHKEFTNHAYSLKQVHHPELLQQEK